MRIRWTLLLACCGLVCACVAQADEVVRYLGACDASAAVALDAERFVVASDEDNVLRIYRQAQAEPLATLPLSGFLGTAPDEESDIEAAAPIGSRIYWISSHGRNRNGKLRPARHRFFATEIDSTAVPPVLKPVGRPAASLQADLLAAVAVRGIDLAAAARRAPEATDGFNIEGLAAMPDGRLLVGWRSPLVEGKALLVPLDNPEQVVMQGAAARWGEPVTLALGGRGIRSIESVAGGYLIVAGPTADAGSFALYRWSGRKEEPPQQLSAPALGSLRPEALFALPGDGGLQLLSDDGGVLSGGAECKRLPASQRAFRSLRFRLP